MIPVNFLKSRDESHQDSENNVHPVRAANPKQVQNWGGVYRCHSHDPQTQVSGNHRAHHEFTERKKAVSTSALSTPHFVK